MADVFALIDCNSFYCSCEQVFRPHLWGKPLVVLSNNDGCVISRTKEAKALGIKMGEPEFKMRSLFKGHGVKVFSSNYTLYGDMSRRVQEVIAEHTPSFEIYSIDELFMNLEGFENRGLTEYCHKVKQAVLKETGIPTGVGIGPTKTLAKIANHLAKTFPSYNGVSNLMDEYSRNELLNTLPISEIWGIGHRTIPKLQAMGIFTAGQLRDMNLKQARQYGSVVNERLVLELRGLSCIPLEEIPVSRKGTAVTRSFGRYIYEFEEIMEALTLYISRGGEKLRSQDLVAGTLTVFMHTNPHKPVPQYHGSRTVKLLNMTDDTRELLEEVRILAKSAFRKGYEYSKAGIMLDDLRPKFERPLNFFKQDKDNSVMLMKTLDRVNHKHGRNTLYFGSQGVQNQWKMRSAFKSPCYTTRITDVPRVKAD